MNTAHQTKPILGKVIMKGTLICETGLHIGAQGGTGEIGGVDKPVVRDSVTQEPFIPGTSLKGKLRALLERALDKPFNHKGARDVWRHECPDRACEVCRVFGSAGRADGGDRKLEPMPARLTVRDLRLTPESVRRLSEIDTGLLYTEVKHENSLDRVTSAANPRQLERVPAGAAFRFELIYTVESRERSEVEQDLQNLIQTLGLLEDDALGGSGSRGYGKVGILVQHLTARKVAFYGGEAAAELMIENKGEISPDKRPRVGEQIGPDDWQRVASHFFS